MRTTLIFLTLLSIALCSFAQQNNNPNYDAALAEKLQADDYGMKAYVLVLLKTGSNTSRDEPARSSAFAGHMENIGKMVEQNKLVVAGPMLQKNEREYRGIFILTTPTIEEAEILLQTDPAIAAKYLDAELYSWYGSAALSEYLEASDKIWKVKP